MERILDIPVTVTRDGVWGGIPLNRPARALLDTPALQRLRAIRCLPLAQHAYPEARHTLFEHSLGVYHLMLRALEQLASCGAHIEEKEIRTSLSAALLHEAGATPHRTALAGLGGAETLRRRSILEGEVLDVLNSYWEIDPPGVLRLIEGDPGDHLSPTERLLKDLLFGALDLHSLDAIARDAAATGLPYAGAHLGDLVGLLRVVGEKDRALLAVEEDHTGLAQSLFCSRYLMHYNVYGHHSLRIPAAMMLRAATDALADEVTSAEELTAATDSRALSALMRSPSSHLIERIEEGKQYECAFTLDPRHPAHATLRRVSAENSWKRWLEDAFCSHLSRRHHLQINPTDIIIDVAPTQKHPFELRIIGRSPTRPTTEPAALTWAEISATTPEDLHRQHLPLDRVRVVARDKTTAEEARRHAAELFTIAEELG